MAALFSSDTPGQTPSQTASFRTTSQADKEEPSCTNHPPVQSEFQWNVFSFNSVGTYSTPYRGGAILTIGDLHSLKDHFFGNSAPDEGGAISHEGGSLLLESATIQECSAASGGGLYIQAGFANISGGTIALCNATNGGGVYVAGGTPYFDSFIVEENWADDYGGGAYLAGLQSNWTLCKFNRNCAGINGSQYFEASGANTFLNCEVKDTSCTSSSREEYFVSPGGNDTNPGDQSFPFRTIIHAVSVADDGDQILLMNGTFSEVDTIFVKKSISFASASGLQDVMITAPAASVTMIDLSSGNCSFSNLIFNCSGATSTPCLKVDASVLTLLSVTVQDSAASAVNGGAILLTNSDLAATGCTFSNNHGLSGAVLYINGGNTTLENCTFSNNAASVLNFWTGGGAVCVTGFKYPATTNIFNCTFEANSSPQSGGAIFSTYGAVLNVYDSSFLGNAATNWGGAIMTYEGPPAITNLFNCTFEGNTASNGGAIYNWGTTTITGCNFSNNGNLSTSGGAIYNEGISGFFSTVLVLDSTFVGNLAYDGGAIISKSYTLTDVNSSTFINNTAAGLGGAVYLLNGQHLWNQCDFACNTAASDNTTNTSYPPASSNGVFVCTGCSDCCNNSCTNTSSSSTSTSTSTSTTTSTSTSSSSSSSTSTYTYTSTSTSTLSSVISSSPSSVPSALVTSTVSLTSTSELPTSSSFSTTSSSTQPDVQYSSNCTISCPGEVVFGGSNNASQVDTTTWEIQENSTSVQLNVTTSGGSTLSFQVGWGAIREVSTSGEVIKVADPVAENWDRIIQRNETTVVISYATVEHRPPWQDEPVSIALTTILNLGVGSNSSGSSVASAKFSLTIDGNWQFDQPSNSLDADFIVRASFNDVVECGQQKKYRLDSSNDEDVYHFGSKNSSAVSLTILRHCLVDGVRRETASRAPVLFDNNTAANVTIRFPSFASSLYYDPNFALLLGYSPPSSSCNALYTWILPASFLAAAGAIVLAVILLSFAPPVQAFILGPEGTRVSNLRGFVSENKLGLDANLDFATEPDDCKVSGW